MAEQTIEIMISYFGKDLKRINHALKVYGFACAIAASEKLSMDEIEIIKLAAIFHDIGIVEAEKKFNSSAGHLQEQEGPAVARVLLSSQQIRAEIMERVCYLIGNHHSYQKINGIDLQILVEADFLVNIFEDKMSEKAIQAAKKNIFKTPAGKKMLEDIYCQNMFNY